ncbi:hypothetical protein R76727_04134 [Ralstonia mannitolilytica]|uniref:hypothetical protein n=1 Tax=Ralstonia mannitolilytica TaxID=105219 RepID=UPI0028F5D7BD|nr:hypothetical protein R76727_04134 [Ralstonia mannitolilytica]
MKINRQTAVDMRPALLILLLASSPALAQVGFYKRSDPPGVARQWGELCIQKGAAGALKVSLFGGYCPTVESDCSNMRFDEIDFEAEAKKGVRGLRGAAVGRFRVGDVQIDLAAGLGIVRAGSDAADAAAIGECRPVAGTTSGAAFQPTFSGPSLCQNTNARTSGHFRFRHTRLTQKQKALPLDRAFCPSLRHLPTFPSYWLNAVLPASRSGAAPA